MTIELATLVASAERDSRLRALRAARPDLELPHRERRVRLPRLRRAPLQPCTTCAVNLS